MGKVNGKANRQKGHNYERYLAKRFRSLGYTFCKTSRAASRVLDSCKVDLAFIPYNVQAKKVKATINYSEVFEEMQTTLEQNYPPTAVERSNVKMIFHSKGKKPSEKYVILQEEDMFKLLKKLQEAGYE